MLPYLPGIRERSQARVVLRSVNVEFRIWEQLAARQTNLVRRAAYAAIARTLRRHEVANLNTCDAVVPITAADAPDLRMLGCTVPMHVLPPGIEVSVGAGFSRPAEAGPHTVGSSALSIFARIRMPRSGSSMNCGRAFSSSSRAPTSISRGATRRSGCARD